MILLYTIEYVVLQYGGRSQWYNYELNGMVARYYPLLDLNFQLFYHQCSCTEPDTKESIDYKMKTTYYERFKKWSTLNYREFS